MFAKCGCIFLCFCHYGKDGFLNRDDDDNDGENEKKRSNKLMVDVNMLD